MTAGLPASGQISIGLVSVEILRSSTATTGLNETDVRTLFGQPSGSVDLNTGHGKRWVVPNSNTFTSSGSFSVPRYEYITVQVWGGGGGGGGGGGNDSWAYGYNGGEGGAGGSTTAYSLTAYGGGPGGPGYNGGAGSGTGPAGSTITNGGGAAGGAARPGNNGYATGGLGGPGGYVSKTWRYSDSGAPSWFGSISVTIGGGGGGGAAGENNAAGYPGSAGQAVISWT